MKTTLIVAVSDNGVIGTNNKLPWKIPGELKRFKKETISSPVIMGSKTGLSIFKEIGSLLPQRTNIVVSRKAALSFPGADVVSSVEKALEHARQSGTEKAYIIGGGQIYQYALDHQLVDEMLITRVHVNVEGEDPVYFPSIDPEKWNIVESTDYQDKTKDGADIAYTIERLERKAA